MPELVPYEKCPLCGGDRFVALRSGNCANHPLYKRELSPEMQWIRCETCGHIFRNGYYTDDMCRVIFSGTNESQHVGYDIEGQRQISARIIDKILPFKSSGTWLDVGFGNGSLLFTAQEYGFHPIGIDLRSQNVELLRRLGIDALCQDIRSLTPEPRYSVISMADVLEHMPFPKEGLNAAYNLLEDGGILFLSMPNFDNVLWRLLDGANLNPYWGELEHYHNFSRSRLYALLNEHGFTPLRYGVSERYRVGMEVLARKEPRSRPAPSG
jgi:2-polyprenyl-3-methyl-5-hydroxy-6-metoxy-1,4-benzoquinol methylase